MAAAFATGNALEALLGSWLCRSLLNTDTPFRQIRDAFAWGAAAAGSSVIAATVGAGSLVASGHANWTQLAANWWTWWLGDVAGLMVVAPLILVLAQRRSSCWAKERPLEGGLFLALLLIVSQCVFGGWLPERSAASLLYLPLILLFWAVLRFGLVEVTLTTFLFAVAAIWGTSRGVGPLGTETVQRSLFDLQVFMIVYALTGLGLAGLVARTRQAESGRTLLAAAVESAGEAILIADAHGMIQYVNTAFEQLNGYCAAEVIGSNPRILKSGDTQGSVYREMWETIAGGKIWRGSFRNRRKDGSLYDVDQTVAPVKNRAGNITHYVSVARDLTERRAYEGAKRTLRANEVQFQIARDIQRRLYPSSSPAVAEFDCAGTSHPAEAAGGDYFDYLHFRDGTIGFVVGDVSGHGIGPALLMAETRAYLQALANTCSDVGEILTLLNRFLTEDTDSDHFVTIFLGRMDPAQRSFVYASAGHQSLLLDKESDAKPLDATAIPVGMMRSLTVPTAPAVTLKPGDLVLLLTDGIPEAHAPNGQMFGIDRVLDVVKSCRQQSAKEIVDALCHAAQSFSGHARQADDMTAMVLKAEFEDVSGETLPPLNETGMANL